MPQAEFRESPGSLRPSQITTTFGPGSLVQTEHDSVIVMGMDMWSSNEKNYKMLGHPYLEAILGKDHFRMPVSAGMSRVISCRSFPTWGVCSNVACSRLQRHKAAPPGGRRMFRCDDCRSELHAARFVVICDRGHLDDFPWEEWAHSSSSGSEPCKSKPKLRFRARGKSPGISDYYVACDTCGRSRSCGYATSRNALRDIVPACSGRMPWLGKREACASDGRPVYGFHVLSTGLYYPVTIAALHVPEWLHPIQRCITKNKQRIEGMCDIDPTYRKVADNVRSQYPDMKKYAADEIIGHLERRFALKTQFGKGATELQIRDKEYENLILGETTNFEYGEELEIGEGQLDPGLAGYVERMKLINRITEIRAICAFTRGEAPDPYSAVGKNVHYCSISKRTTDWYPAVENKGEGFLFILDEDRLREWENTPAVITRCRPPIDAFRGWAEQKGWASHEAATARYILLHTLSHVLIRDLADLSGYGEASIRERIYNGENRNGILLYTASPSSDGSLGGLVRQGMKENFGRLLASAIARSRHCSRDPLCAEDDLVEKGRGSMPLHARLNGSACYGCALLPETSCENNNRLLDRRLLFDKNLGFFRKIGA